MAHAYICPQLKYSCPNCTEGGYCRLARRAKSQEIDCPENYVPEKFKRKNYRDPGYYDSFEYWGIDPMKG